MSKLSGKAVCQTLSDGDCVVLICTYVIDSHILSLLCECVCLCVHLCVKAQRVDQQCAVIYICPLPSPPLPSPLLPSPLLPTPPLPSPPLPSPPLPSPPHPSLLQGRVVSTIKHAGISAESVGMQTASISSDTVAIRDRKDERGTYVRTCICITLVHTTHKQPVYVWYMHACAHTQTSHLLLFTLHY